MPQRTAPACVRHPLRDLSSRAAFGRTMLPNGTHLERLFFGPDWQRNTQPLPRGIAEYCLEPAAQVKLPSDFWVLNNRTLPLTEEFAVEIQPLALRLPFINPGATI
jgi:hypothetical protein